MEILSEFKEFSSKTLEILKLLKEWVDEGNTKLNNLLKSKKNEKEV